LCELFRVPRHYLDLLCKDGARDEQRIDQCAEHWITLNELTHA